MPPNRTLAGALSVGVVLAVATSLFLIRPPWEQVNLREGDELWFLNIGLALADGQDAWLWPNDADTGMDKPPGFLALVGASFVAWGHTTWAGRFPSALMMVLAALLVALAARRLSGPLLALLAGLALLTPPYLYAPRGAWAAVTEPALVAAMAAVLAIALRLLEPGKAPLRPRLWGGLLGVVLGWMTLLKTAIVLLPLAGLGAAVAVVGRQGRCRLLRAAPWTLLSLVLAAGAWPALLLMKGKGEYLDGIWFSGGLAKIGDVIGGSSREPLYLITHTASGLGSLLPVAVVALGVALLPGDLATRGARRLAAAFVAVTLLLFSLTATQWPWYSVPALPFLALLVGLAAVEAARRPHPWLVAVLAAAVAAGLLFHQPWVRSIDLVNPEVGLLEVPFMVEPAGLLARRPVRAVLLGLALPVGFLLGWSRLGSTARAGLAAALVLSITATSAVNLMRIQWFPEVRPDSPLLTLVDLALAKEARGGEEDWGLNDGYYRFQLATLEHARTEPARRIRVQAVDPGSSAALILERARPVQPREDRPEFPGEPMELRGAAHVVEFEVELGPDEPLLLRLRRAGENGGSGTLEAVDCLRLFRLDGTEPVDLTLRFGALLPDAVPAGVQAEVFCGATRPHYRARPSSSDPGRE